MENLIREHEIEIDCAECGIDIVITKDEHESGDKEIIEKEKLKQIFKLPIDPKKTGCWYHLNDNKRQ